MWKDRGIFVEEKYLVCEDSLEGIFTGIYDAYALREGHEHIHIQIGEETNYRLFADYRYISPDFVKTDKVAGTLKKRLGENVYYDICRAAASYNKEEKGDAIYRTVVDGITGGSGRRVMENLRNPYVARTFELARYTANEAHYEIEFLRFEELEQGILYAVIGPKNSVIPFVMPHFADRLSIENFIIHDEKHGLFGVHAAKKEWYLVSEPEGFTDKRLKRSKGEEQYRALFTIFHKTTGIMERENKRLQRQMCPIRYQEYMMEFDQK
ncbi:MAG: TIGR03915 family putative DNA repair protein [Clostridiales bacterium]|nr:TIGR03915 family putative DNA repair protein [Clostridiales bacterium]